MLITFCAGVLFAVSAGLDGAPTIFPAHVAFNRGSFTAAANKAATVKGVADASAPSPSRDVVRHLRVEVFENSGQATTAQTTLFGFCISTFDADLRGQRSLTSVAVEYLLLDAAGVPVADRTVLVEYRSVLGLDKKKLVWEVKASDGGGTKALHAPMPNWAKERLWVLSGFLKANPGTPPVEYAKTSAENALSLFGFLLDYAPGAAKKLLLATAETALKNWTREAAMAALKEKKGRWGVAQDLTHPKTSEFRKAYVVDGRTIWSR
jgi:hypothetical protein